MKKMCEYCIRTSLYNYVKCKILNNIVTNDFCRECFNNSCKKASEIIGLVKQLEIPFT